MTPAKLLEAANDFARSYVEPASASWEKAGAAPDDAFVVAARYGLTGVLVPKELGGHALCFVEALPILEELAKANAAFAFALWVHNNVSNGLAQSGQEAAIDRYLPAMLDGKSIGAFCLTEPDIGSDATRISTLATRGKRGWVLQGTKSWVTNGTRSDVLIVYAQTQKGAGANGIAAFVVHTDEAEVKRGNAYDLPGASAFGINDIQFQGCVLEDHALLVPPGEGFKEALKRINQARTFVGALCCGMLSSSVEAAMKYAARRQAFGKRVLDHQAVQWLLADTATELEAAKLLTRRAAEVLDSGGLAIEEVAHAKKFASAAAFDGVSRCQQAMGAAGLRAEYPLSRHLVASKMTHFIDGTTEMQNLAIARTMMRRYGVEPV